MSRRAAWRVSRPFARKSEQAIQIAAESGAPRCNLRGGELREFQQRIWNEFDGVPDERRVRRELLSSYVLPATRLSRRDRQQFLQALKGEKRMRVRIDP